MRSAARGCTHGKSRRHLSALLFEQRIREADEFYAELPTDSETSRAHLPAGIRGAAVDQAVLSLRRRGLAGGRPGPADAPARTVRSAATRDWTHLYNRDVISMPDNWEYPWYAAWDLAFHMIPFAQLDPCFAKDQLILLLREWYMHPNGQIPAYEFAFSRRESAGTCVGLLARVQDDRAARQARPPVSRRAFSRSC